ncbi:MAG: hypothetical protein ACTS5A_01610 [Candidatus Hodgkinia cicadicola]
MGGGSPNILRRGKHRNVTSPSAAMVRFMLSIIHPTVRYSTEEVNYVRKRAKRSRAEPSKVSLNQGKSREVKNPVWGRNWSE